MTGPDLLSTEGANPWQTRSRSVAYAEPSFLIHHDEVLQPDGTPGTYSYIEVPQLVVAIVAVDDQDRVHLVRQWRYPWQRNSWEIPAGHAEKGEGPLQAAQRELAEEVGLEASRWEPLGQGYSSAILATETHYFLARELHTVPVRRESSEQDMLVRAIPFLEALRAASSGGIVHAVSVVGLARASFALGRFPQPQAAEAPAEGRG